MEKMFLVLKNSQCNGIFFPLASFLSNGLIERLFLSHSSMASVSAFQSCRKNHPFHRAHFLFIFIKRFIIIKTCHFCIRINIHICCVTSSL
eukprot:UN10634